MRLSGQFPFFLRNDFLPPRSFCAQKIVAFFVLLVGFSSICVFVHSRFFCKKINRLKIVLITSFTILLMCTSINRSIKNYLLLILAQIFYHTYLFLSVHTYYLSKPIFISQDLFLSERIFSYL